MNQAIRTESNAVICRRDPELRSRIDKQLHSKFLCEKTGQLTHAGWNLSPVKRIIGASIALFILTLLSPLMIAIALAVKLTSKGPVFFAQERTGYLGRRFKMYKFRTMVSNAEDIKLQFAHLSHQSHNSPDFKVRKDPRITPVGRFLRKYSLDELPQLYNVIKGDMRLVGPRPTSFAANTYDEDHLVRLAAPPGLTGMWQISGRSDIAFDQRVELDYQYIVEQSPIQDLKILIKTPLAVLKGDGAY
ncbi:MAG: sugar transferase [Ketobacteraceae bacterium]|nr:sugar transferase [Ketobacteraceae bacterium]